MAKEEEKSGSGTSNLSSKFLRSFLIVLTVFLMFVGPTYVVYVFLNVLDLSYLVSMGFGFGLFIVGFVLLLYLIKKGVIS
jgi:hypothetical protein